MAETEKFDIYERTTNKIVELMEAGKLPWQKSWDSNVGAALVMPINGKTNRGYNAVNSAYLSFVMAEKESEDPRFFSAGVLRAQNREFFQRVQKLRDEKKPIHPELLWEYRIKKGAKATPVLQKWKVMEDKRGNPLPESEQYWARKVTPLFHASDCIRREYERDKEGNILFGEDGKPKYTDHPLKAFVPKTKGYTHEEQYEIAEAILAASGAKIANTSASRAFYSPGRDEIHLPPKAAFKELGDYYAVALHELAHWTGHKSRLNRPLEGREKNLPSYAKEELRAELASTFLALDLGLPMNPTNHAAYVQSWVQELKNDKMEIFKAASDARKIAKYIEAFMPEHFREKGDAPAAAEGVVVDATPVTPEKEGTGSAPAFPTLVTDEKILALPPEAQAKGTARLYKYYLDHRPADAGAVPREGLYFVDGEDKGAKFGAVYYEQQLPASVQTQYELRPDYNYFANKSAHVTIYFRKEKQPDAPSHTPSFGTDYEPVATANYLREGLTIEAVYRQWKEQPPEGKRPIGIGDLIEMDGEIVRAEDIGFQKQKLVPYKDGLVLVEVPDAQTEKLTKAAEEAVGKESYQVYAEKLRQNFYRAGQNLVAYIKHPGTFQQTDSPMEMQRLMMDFAYSQGFRERAFREGLSSYTPTDQKGWQNADVCVAVRELTAKLQGNSFHDTTVPEFKNLLVASIQRNSPYAVISQDRCYGRRVLQEAEKTPSIRMLQEAQKKTSSQERPREAAVAYGR